MAPTPSQAVASYACSNWPSKRLAAARLPRGHCATRVGIEPRAPCRRYRDEAAVTAMPAARDPAETRRRPIRCAIGLAEIHAIRAAEIRRRPGVLIRQFGVAEMAIRGRISATEPPIGFQATAAPGIPHGPGLTMPPETRFGTGPALRAGAEAVKPPSTDPLDHHATEPDYRAIGVACQTTGADRLETLGERDVPAAAGFPSPRPGTTHCRETRPGVPWSETKPSDDVPPASAPTRDSTLQQTGRVTGDAAETAGRAADEMATE